MSSMVILVLHQRESLNLYERVGFALIKWPDFLFYLILRRWHLSISNQHNSVACKLLTYLFADQQIGVNEIIAYT